MTHSPNTNKQRPSFTGSAKFIISVIVGAIGLIASLVTLGPLLISPPEASEIVPDTEVALSLSQKDFVRSPENTHGTTIFRADQLTINDKITLSQGMTILVANRLTFGPAGSLIAPPHIAGKVKLAIAASHIKGGMIELSGGDGPSEGATGISGGTVLIRTGRIDDTQISANGGQGIPGKNGHAGGNGGNGDCGGFGNWDAAESGDRGGNGGNGGNGGDSGLIEIQYGTETDFAVSALPGAGAIGGSGGPGGRGGKGCSGLGGNQNNAPNGPKGADGKSGATGQQTAPKIQPFDYKAYAERVAATSLQSGDFAKIVIDGE